MIKHKFEVIGQKFQTTGYSGLYTVEHDEGERWKSIGTAKTIKKAKILAESWMYYMECNGFVWGE